MRLIDADAFKKYLAGGLRNTINEGIYTIESLLKAERVTNDFMKDIDEQETVDADLARHGHWISYTTARGATIAQCSRCDYHMTDAPTWMGKVDMNYCPDCGAKMDETDD